VLIDGAIISVAWRSDGLKKRVTWLKEATGVLHFKYRKFHNSSVQTSTVNSLFVNSWGKSVHEKGSRALGLHSN
jgi:hypothetical protein